jgi:hypothetical protein
MKINDLFEVSDQDMSDFINPRPKLLIEKDNRKVLCSLEKMDNEIIQIQMICFFHRPEYVDYLSFILEEDAEIKGLKQNFEYKDKRFDFYIIETYPGTGLRKILEQIYSSLDRLYTDPVPESIDRITLKQMRYRGLLVEYNDGSISDYILHECLYSLSGPE